VGSSFELGRIAGIRIGVNWSWLVVFALIVWTLVSGVFPSANPGLSKGTYLGMGIVAALLFFTSLLLHELGHALEARREGMRIEGITLWLFGGVARFSGSFPSAGAEFRIAIAGPLVSLALGLSFVGLALAISSPEEVDGVCAWLGYINLTLLVFNLLPALPLDGGRVLRSLLWLAKGDFAFATALATTIARGIAVLMIGGGLFLLVFQSSFSGAWLAFLGWFLLQAAAGEARYLAVREALGDLRVRDVMVSDPVTVPADLPLGLFMDQVAWARRYTTYPVVENDRPVGLLAFRSLAEVPRSEWDSRTVRDCMISLDRLPALSEEQTAVDALVELQESEINRGLVLDGERLAGLVSITDLARALEVRPASRR
jgi:Zn-dependent protease/predicted transcriptional regulator